MQDQGTGQSGDLQVLQTRGHHLGEDVFGDSFNLSVAKDKLGLVLADFKIVLQTEQDDLHQDFHKGGNEGGPS